MAQFVGIGVIMNGTIMENYIEPLYQILEKDDDPEKKVKIKLKIDEWLNFITGDGQEKWDKIAYWQAKKLIQSHMQTDPQDEVLYATEVLMNFLNKDSAYFTKRTPAEDLSKGPDDLIRRFTTFVRNHIITSLGRQSRKSPSGIAMIYDNEEKFAEIIPEEGIVRQFSHGHFEFVVSDDEVMGKMLDRLKKYIESKCSDRWGPILFTSMMVASEGKLHGNVQFKKDIYDILYKRFGQDDDFPPEGTLRRRWEYLKKEIIEYFEGEFSLKLSDKCYNHLVPKHLRRGSHMHNH